jgi:2-polyprenyl-6-methoxyphenol hydroxylase-like FAD-dependent oxidoreductase
MTTVQEQAPVLVVGAGPVGMIAALELARHGVPCMLVEQNSGTTVHPKMEFSNPRTMEFYARLGIGDEIRAAGVAPGHSFDVVWSTGLDGRRLAVWPQPSVTEKWRQIREQNDGTQPSQPYQRISQTDLEPVLRSRCEKHPLIDVRAGWRFCTLDQDVDGVRSRLEHTRTGSSIMVRSQYAVGCDGAASTVRRTLGIPVGGGSVADDDSGGVDNLPAAYSVTFTSRDLESLHRQGYFWHYFTYRYVLISLDENGTWSFHAMDPADFDPMPDDPVARMRSVLGVDLAVDEVLVTSRWTPQYLIADRYRHGRVLLAGDAAHQMFPAGSHGMNTGAGDAVDIGWKLAALVHGFGGPRLLDSYQAERRPVGLRNMAMSRHHLQVHFTQMSMVRGGADLAEVGAFLAGQPPENTYEGVYLGYRYGGSPIVCADGSPEPEWVPQRYTPTTWPGGRPPSLVLGDGTPLYDLLGPEFTLVDFAGDGRGDKLLAAAADQQLPVHHLVLGDEPARSVWERDLVLVRPDQHVAWRGDAPPPDPADVVRKIRGAP